jgi:hypothetical protein
VFPVCGRLHHCMRGNRQYYVAFEWLNLAMYCPQLRPIRVPEGGAYLPDFATVCKH